MILAADPIEGHSSGLLYLEQVDQAVAERPQLRVVETALGFRAMKGTLEPLLRSATAAATSRWIAEISFVIA
jgi:hypothetical protein